MPIDDIDIYRSAKMLIDRHGGDAVTEASKRADRLSDAGDLDGAAVWRRIVAAIGELQKTEPSGAVH